MFDKFASLGVIFSRDLPEQFLVEADPNDVHSDPRAFNYADLLVNLVWG